VPISTWNGFLILESNDMLRSKLFAAGLLASFLPAATHAAENVEYVRRDGREYMITKRVVNRPMSKTDYKEVAREVYREEYVTDTHDVTRLVQVPVTEYRWETHWANRWNPFSQPYLVQRLVPCTRLETRTEIVKLPVTQKRLVPETHISKVPETVRWMEPETHTIEVAIDPPAGRDVSSIAARPDIGGKKLEGDPPRSGTPIKR
jgi:hypothetical protein